MTDFIVELLKTKNKFDAIIMMICKFSKKIEFIKFLSAFKWIFNNSLNASTDCLLNEIIYDFKLADSFNIVTAGTAEDFETQWKIHQQKAQDSIAWANLIMKHCYDKHHISLLLNSDDLVMLKLHHEYCVSDVKNKKLLI